MCCPQKEGRVGFRSLKDMSRALFAKLWWNFRVSTSSLWEYFMWNKYCKKLHPTIARGTSVSQVWKIMISVREEVDHEIWWQIKSGNVSF